MPISITAPRAPSPISNPSSPSDSGSDSDTSLPIPTSKRRKRAHILTPGEAITSDPQWMRGHGTYLSHVTSFADSDSSSPTITSSLAGTVARTNRLLSLTPLRSRYNPEIGDLVVGRVVSVQQNRWKVDLGAPLLASLPLSAINLPGGVLRRRTGEDELMIRTYFREGECVLAEVQQLMGDGSAGLAARSLRYGKLKGGMFLSVSGQGGRDGGIVRSRRQMFVLGGDGSEGVGGGGGVEVVLGVNGFVWIGKAGAVTGGKVEGEGGVEGGPLSGGAKIGLTNIEDRVNERMYEARNEEVDAETRMEIVRVAGVVRALAEGSIRVDEETVRLGFDIAEDMAGEEMEVDGAERGPQYLGGENGTNLAREVRERIRSR